jgi:DNA-binding Lrp family transcriptional regulator
VQNIAHHSHQYLRKKPNRKETQMLTRRQYAGINELARGLRIDPAAVSRRVSRLEASGEIQTRGGPRRAKLVDIADYCRVAGIKLESFDAPPTMIESMAMRRQLGDGADQDRRMAAARSYCLLAQSALEDSGAKKSVEKLDVALGSIDRDLLRAVIVENQSPTEISKLKAWPLSLLLARIRIALDLVADIV